MNSRKTQSKDCRLNANKFLGIENTAGKCESPTLCVQASLSGNGRKMWSVSMITGRVEVLCKETKSQVEMGTGGRVRGVRPRTPLG